MNKKLLAVALLLLGIVAVKSAKASVRLDNTYTTLEVTASSLNVVSGPAWVKSVQLSTPTSGSTYGTDWLVLIDTAGATPGLTFGAFASSRKKTVPLIYTSTPTANAANSQPNSNIYVFPEPGIFFSSAVYVYKTQTNSGEAFKAIINYKQ